MIITNIGQAGLCIETGNKIIMVDPYFSDSVGKLNSEKHRRVPVDERFYDLDPDVLIFTHDHLDHYDPETAEHFLSMEYPKTVFAPRTAWEKARKVNEKHNYVLVSPGVRWAEDTVDFRFVSACHSDPYAVGVMIYAEGKCLYITGDTLFNDRILEEIGDDEEIDYIFLPINGVGNNMNESDAAFFAEALDAHHIIPMHVGMLDDKTTDGFEAENKLVLPIYQGLEVE